MDSTRWQRLVSYYRSCVSAENTTDAQFQLANDGRDFVHVFNEKCISDGTGMLEFGDRDESFRSFMQVARWGKAPATYFYGFPCRIEGQFIRPIFIFDVEETASDAGRAFVVQSNQPRFNAAGLGSLLQEERRQAAQTLSDCWDENKPLYANVDATLQRLQAILPNLNRNDLFSNWDGVFFRAIDSTYTRGLEQELMELEDGSSPNPVWELVLDRSSQPIDASEQEILEITPLNDEQRRAVKSAFANTLTVVTGPPGTGKSQIVLNVIANAIERGETVLFGSRINKAVDVVVDRLSSMFSLPVILQHKAQGMPFADKLFQALSRASSQNKEALDREILDVESELERIRRGEQQAYLTLNHIVNRRNRIRQTEAAMEDLLAEVPEAIATTLRPYEAPRAGQSLADRLAMLEETLREAERPTLMTQIRAILGKPLDKRLQEAAASLLLEMPACCAYLPTTSVGDCQEVASIARPVAHWLGLNLELLKLANQNWNEPRIDLLRARIASAQKRAVGLNIDRVGLLMQRRLMNLTPGQRRAVSDYAVNIRALQSGYAGEDMEPQLRRASTDAFRNGIRAAFPAIAVTNLSVRSVAPLTPNAVDLVVIDEASQCDMASALPLLYRGRRALVIGDPEQLQHISHLRQADDARLRNNAALISMDDQRLAYSNSLFNIAQGTIGSGAYFTQLNEHYRSREEIIGFSNRHFYGSSLAIHTDYREHPLVTSANAITWHHIEGNTVRPQGGSAVNDAEAQAVVRLLQEIVSMTASQPELRPSLGVVTPFREQARKIHELAGRSIDGVELQGLEFVVGTAYSYQGDEKDIMIFSPVISRNAPDSTVRFVGNTPNLFNVAITRARAELHIVGDRTACEQSGSFLFEFVRYVDSLQSGRPPEQTQQPFESHWEEVFHNALKDAGVYTFSQYHFDQYKLDLAIPESMIDIEVDGARWHRNLDGSRVLSDLKRDTHLTSRGWRVKRFWVYELRSDLDRCVREIKEMLAA